MAGFSGKTVRQHALTEIWEAYPGRNVWNLAETWKNQTVRKHTLPEIEGEIKNTLTEM